MCGMHAANISIASVLLYTSLLPVCRSDAMLRLTTRVERVSPVNESIWAAIETMMRDADAALGIEIAHAAPTPTLTEPLLMKQFARNYDALMGLAAKPMDLRMSPGDRSLCGRRGEPALRGVSMSP
jgi:hypothetical protein